MTTQKTQHHKKLNTRDMVIGIGRKASDEELLEYLSREPGTESISLELAFSKYIAAADNKRDDKLR